MVYFPIGFLGECSAIASAIVKKENNYIYILKKHKLEVVYNYQLDSTEHLLKYILEDGKYKQILKCRCYKTLEKATSECTPYIR